VANGLIGRQQQLGLSMGMILEIVFLSIDNYKVRIIKADSLSFTIETLLKPAE